MAVSSPAGFRLRASQQASPDRAKLNPRHVDETLNGAQHKPERLTASGLCVATALFRFAVAGHAGAIHVRLVGAPAMLSETARRAHAVLDRLGARAAHTARTAN